MLLGGKSIAFALPNHTQLKLQANTQLLLTVCLKISLPSYNRIFDNLFPEWRERIGNLLFEIVELIFYKPTTSKLAKP